MNFDIRIGNRRWHQAIVDRPGGWLGLIGDRSGCLGFYQILFPICPQCGRDIGRSGTLGRALYPVGRGGSDTVYSSDVWLGLVEEA